MPLYCDGRRALVAGARPRNDVEALERDLASVITSTELPVNDCSFPITPEIGGTAFAWAKTAEGIASALNIVTWMKYCSGCFICGDVLSKRGLDELELIR